MRYIDYHVDITEEGFHWPETGLERLFLRDDHQGFKPGDLFELTYKDDDTLFLKKVNNSCTEAGKLL